jgi:hypothetical protein
LRHVFRYFTLQIPRAFHFTGELTEKSPNWQEGLSLHHCPVENSTLPVEKVGYFCGKRVETVGKNHSNDKNCKNPKT